MKRGFLIYNPSAGGRAKTRLQLDDVVKQFAVQQIEIIPCPSKAGGSVIRDVGELVQEKPDLFVAWGGDGTINEVVNGLFGSGIPLGILPGGTANLMVRELNIPKNVSSAVRVIGSGNSRRISVGQANDRYFLLMVGIGFDSAVIQNVSPPLKRRFGKLAFGISALHTAIQYQFPAFDVRYNGEETRSVFAIICNARHYAAYFVLTPDADISDEFLYVCLFQDPGLARMFLYAFHAFKRTHLKLDSVKIVRAKEVTVSGSEAIVAQADGELVGTLPVHFSIHPHSLEVFTPVVRMRS